MPRVDIVLDLAYLRTACGLSPDVAPAAFEAALASKLNAEPSDIGERQACDVQAAAGSPEATLHAQLRDAGYTLVLAPRRPLAPNAGVEADVACCLLELAGALGPAAATSSSAAASSATPNGVAVVLVGGDADWSRVMERALSARALHPLHFVVFAHE